MDHDWTDRLSAGHPGRAAALEELRAILLRGLRSGLQGRARADSAFLEDITQDALLRILDRLHTYQGRSQFTSWALSVALRVAFNELRRREWNNVSLQDLQARAGDIAEEADPAASPTADLERRELSDYLYSVMQTDLTPRQRDVLLCELNGMPQEEIARQLHTTRNNVYKLFHDARKALKRALVARGHDQYSLLSPGHSAGPEGHRP